MIPRRNARRRALPWFCALAAAGGLLGAGSVHAAAQGGERLFQPEVQVQERDYAAVRRAFRTHLLKAAAAPQAEPRHRPPPGVDEVEYRSGTLTLHAWISGQNDGGRRLPAVIFLHGGFAFGPADWEMARPYWEAGYVLMMPMLRGENGQGGAFSLFYGEVGDVLSAAAYLRRQPGVDPSRIFVAGHSAGGTLALLSAEASARFRAAVSFDASPDQQLLYHGSASKPGVHPEVVFDPEDRRELEVRSPLAWAASLKAPARLFYSTQAAVYVQHPTERLVEVARAKGLDVAAVRVPGTHLSHVSAAMRQSIDFINRHGGLRTGEVLHRRTVPPPRLSLRGNTTFALAGFGAARAVTLAGTFNDWRPDELLCGREAGRWVCRIDLPPGRHLYKFVVDGEWILDPANPSTERDGDGNTNSVLVK